MKKMTWAAAFMSVGLLAACSGEPNEIQQTEEEKAQPKTEETAADPQTEESSQQENEAQQDDIWTYYNDATWSDDYEGLKTTIQKVVVSNEAPRIDENGEEVKSSAVGVKFQIENTTEEKFTTYPDQATLVTSTGEQVQADMIVSDSLGGEIDKGVIKEGDVIFYLERGAADQIEWIKLKWNGHKGGEDEIDGEYKEWEPEIQLK